MGFGFDPLDERQLSYVYGDSLRAVASMALILANQGFWLNQAWTGADWARVLNGQQALKLHAPLPAEATVYSQLRIIKIIDKGASKGAYIVCESDLVDLQGDRRLATLIWVDVEVVSYEAWSHQRSVKVAVGDAVLNPYFLAGALAAGAGAASET